MHNPQLLGGSSWFNPRKVWGGFHPSVYKRHNMQYNAVRGWPLDPPLNALSWNLKDSHVFSGSFFLIYKNERKKLEFPEMGGSYLPGGVRTPLGPL